MLLCVLISLRLSTLHSSQSLSSSTADLPLHLFCGPVRSKITCALPRMRTLALWPITPVSQVISTFRIRPIAAGRFRTLALEMGEPQTKTFRMKPTVPGCLTDVRKRTSRNIYVRPSKLIIVPEQDRQLPKRARSEPQTSSMRTDDNANRLGPSRR